MLTLTNTHATERDPSGTSEGGGIGSGGAPIRYEFTGRGRNTISPWNDANYTYSIFQLQIGSNPISKLEVASALNTLNLSRGILHYNYQNCTSNYYPKVYIGTTQTVSDKWIYDNQNTSKPPANTWPQNFGQTSRKGEANIQYVDK